MSRSSLVRVGIIALGVSVAACAGASDSQTGDAATAGESGAASGEAALAADLENVRAATERFNDVNVALAEGYLRDPNDMCVTAAMEGQPAELGAMGIHYLRPDLVGIMQGPGRVNGTGTHTDFTQPGVLVYEPQADGSLKLVAIENLVWAAAWAQAGNTAPPSYHGNDYVYMIDDPATPADEAHGFEPHYELHIWLYRENPNGRFAPFNPAVTCDHHAHAATGSAGD